MILSLNDLKGLQVRKIVYISDDIKADTLNKFFSSVFSQEEVTKSHLPVKRNLLNMPTITFDEDDILDRLSKLNITNNPLEYIPSILEFCKRPGMLSQFFPIPIHWRFQNIQEIL